MIPITPNQIRLFDCSRPRDVFVHCRYPFACSYQVSVLSGYHFLGTKQMLAVVSIATPQEKTYCSGKLGTACLFLTCHTFSMKAHLSGLSRFSCAFWNFVPFKNSNTSACFNPETGEIDRERLQRNMYQATEAYINRTNGAPCGDTEIQLFKGPDSTVNQELCTCHGD